jgi:hypothetical protein
LNFCVIQVRKNLIEKQWRDVVKKVKACPERLPASLIQEGQAGSEGVKSENGAVCV